MRVEIFDADSQAHVISSYDPRIIGDWFAEHARLLITSDTRMLPYKINIWPSTHEEFQAVGSMSLTVNFTQDGLLHLAEAILEASKKLGDIESASGRA